ncbi:exosporium protein C [Fontibacillus sp. BL9]|uniref:exosporium protein C n=1 Tax=Fontibacillus sp. BL9 TaxID=3389971 RepID=UPI00397BBEAE
MAVLIEHVINVPTPIANGAAINVPQTPAGQGIALVRVTIPAQYPVNRVQLDATVGLQGITGIPRVLFRVFRDGTEIYYAVQGVEADFENVSLTSLIAADINVAPGVHDYVLSVENLEAGTQARVIGPIVFTALATA